MAKQNIEQERLDFEGNIEGMGDVYSHPPFAQALDCFNRNSIEVITLRDFAYMMPRFPKERFPTQLIDGKKCFRDLRSFVKEGVIFTPRSHLKLLISDTPMIREPQKAEDYAREDYNFSRFDYSSYFDIVEENKRKEAQERNVFCLDYQGFELLVPTNRFGDEEITLWAFKDQARKFGDYLRFEGVKNILFLFVGSENVDSRGTVDARQFEIGYHPDGFCSIYGCANWAPQNGARVFGLRR